MLVLDDRPAPRLTVAAAHRRRSTARGERDERLEDQRDTAELRHAAPTSSPVRARPGPCRRSRRAASSAPPGARLRQPARRVLAACRPRGSRPSRSRATGRPPSRPAGPGRLRAPSPADAPARSAATRRGVPRDPFPLVGDHGAPSHARVAASRSSSAPATTGPTVAAGGVGAGIEEPENAARAGCQRGRASTPIARRPARSPVSRAGSAVVSGSAPPLSTERLGRQPPASGGGSVSASAGSSCRSASILSSCRCSSDGGSSSAPRTPWRPPRSVAAPCPAGRRTSPTASPNSPSRRGSRSTSSPSGSCRPPGGPPRAPRTASTASTARSCRRRASSRIPRSCSWTNAYTCSFGMNSSRQSTVSVSGIEVAAAVSSRTRSRTSFRNCSR